MHSTLDKFIHPSRTTRRMTPSCSCRHQRQPPSIGPRLSPPLLVAILLAVVTPLAKAIPDECFLPLNTGNGGFPMMRYFYSSTKGVCDSFLYWSTGGNANNFETLEDCEDTCMPSSVSPTQPTLATTSATPTVLQNDSGTVSTETTPTGSDNNHVTLATETSPTPTTTEILTEAPSHYPTEICHLPKFNLPCLPIQVVTRYWYNKDTNNCEQFFFFSCHGNENNFLSYEECMATCEVVAPAPASSPALSPTPSPTPSPSLDAPHPSPSLTQTSDFSTVAMETTMSVPPPINPPSVQPHPPQNTAIPPSPTPLAPSNVDKPTDMGPTTTDELPSVSEPNSVHPTLPSPTEDDEDHDTDDEDHDEDSEDSTDQSPSEDSTDKSPSENVPSESHSRTLSTFDIASIAVGVVAVLLGLLLVAIVILLVCKRRWKSERLKALHARNYAAASQSRLKQFSYDSRRSYI